MAVNNNVCLWNVILISFDFKSAWKSISVQILNYLFRFNGFKYQILKLATESNNSAFSCHHSATFKLMVWTRTYGPLITNLKRRQCFRTRTKSFRLECHLSSQGADTTQDIIYKAILKSIHQNCRYHNEAYSPICLKIIFNDFQQWFIALWAICQTRVF